MWVMKQLQRITRVTGVEGESRKRPQKHVLSGILIKVSSKLYAESKKVYYFEFKAVAGTAHAFK